MKLSQPHLSAFLYWDCQIICKLHKKGTFMFGFVDGFVGLDEDSRALALHSDGGVVVEDVASLCKVTVAPHLQVSLAS